VEALRSPLASSSPQIQNLLEEMRRKRIFGRYGGKWVCTSPTLRLEEQSQRMGPGAMLRGLSKGQVDVG